MDDKVQVFFCNSAAMADFMIHNGCKIIRVNLNRKHPGKLVFVFERTPETEEVAARWETEKVSYTW